MKVEVKDLHCAVRHHVTLRFEDDKYHFIDVKAQLTQGDYRKLMEWLRWKTQDDG